ncbi:MAG: helix-turn-helix domain-containing protein [Deltaproteobacteria bacterium]|nr:helix-turn-helix domain-containing protein [Deltaproteobacteria bacterium]
MIWLTVDQVAEYLQLSTMMVYKLAQTGQLPASKIGRVWRFDRDAVDHWLQSRTVGEPPFKKMAREALQDFVKQLKNEFGSNLKQVLVFGSHARGDATEESDLDVLVVLGQIEDYSKTRQKIFDISYKVTFENKKPMVLSTILMSEEKFLSGGSPLLLNIRREGKKAA